ncbi:hypothetical protein M902_3038 [Bacteriovorax sp. BAL6_X]|uniref:hypothetical protein n=1 Tax=Bacteriovorax sp. BAL6_X TaxID=1201290 RepID=UPI0003863495|nr:hypothetical protein [Bacteriovorax sp. BAL6_X]EPZ51434.1 hypothetical protein M902_3038 [Bacteriovorax sp. BAL6_X]
MRFLLLLILFSIFSVNYSYAQEYGLLDLNNGVLSKRSVDHYLRPFQTDGCSSISPQGTFNAPKLWQHCCIEHDVSYWMGGTLMEKITADEELKQCVSDVFSSIFGKAMQVAVYIGGNPSFHTGYAWGYGWNHIRGYHDLTIRDKNEISQKMPKDPQGQEIVELGFDKERIPLKNDNLCLEEVNDFLEKRIKKKVNINVIKEIDKFVSNGFFLEADNCKGTIRAIMKRGVSHNDCRDIPFENKWKRTLKSIEATGECGEIYGRIYLAK